MSRLARASRFLASSLCVALLASTVMTCTDILTPAKLVPAGLVRVSGDTQSGTVAQTLPNPLVVKVVTASGAPIEGVTVTWAVTGGGGSVTTATGITDAAGEDAAVWTLGAVAGANAVSASLQTAPSVAPIAFTATGVPGAPAKLVFSATPAAATAGQALAPAVQVTVQDALGNTVTAATTAVTIAISSGTGTAGAVLGGTLTQTAASGIATFSDLTINKSGAGYALAASATGLTGAASSGFAVSAGAAAKLAFTVQPSAVTAGAAIAPAVQVTVQDALGNTVTTSTAGVTVAITSGTGTSGATLGGTATLSAASGIASFGSLTVNKSGSGYTLTASATGLTAATSGSFTVSAGAAAKLGFTVQPPAATAGTAFAPAVQVTVQDALGNTVTGATNGITLAITGGTGTSGAVLGGTLTQAAASGVASFGNLTIDKSGSGYTLTASASGLTSATSSAFAVGAGAAAKLAFTVEPSAATSGTAVAPAVQVTVQDALGNTVTASTAGVTVAITSGTGTSGAALGGTLTQAAATGVATFNDLTVDKVGTGYTLTASASGLTSAVSSAFAVSAGAAVKLAFTVQPSAATSGTAVAPAVQVTVQDAQGNTVTGATNGITVAITSGTGTSGAALGGTLTQAAAAGVASFGNLTVDKVGTGYTLTATASGLTSATSSAFAVSAGAAAKLAFAVQPSAAVAGVANAPALQVAVQDAQGNTVTSATTNVTVAITSGTGTAGAVLGGTLTRAAASGIATFNDLTVDKAGTGYTLTASASGATDAVSSAFAITPAAVSLAVSAVTVSSPTVAGGGTATLTLQAKDAFGNNLTSGGLTVLFSFSGGTSTGTIGSTNDHGDGTYTAVFTGNLAGTATTIGATIGGTAVTGTLPTLQVTAGAPSTGQSLVTASAGTVASGSAVTLHLQAKDAAGNNVATGGATVVFTASTGAGVSTGTIGSTTDNGDGTYTATFTGVLMGTATTIGATIGGVAVTTALPTVAVTVGPVSTSGSIVSVSNSTVASGLAVTLTLTAKDAAGNALSTGGLTIVFSASGGTSTGLVGGTAVDNGNGTYSGSFTGIVAGTPTTIGATINTAAVTSPLPTVQVTPSAATHLVLTTAAAGAASGDPFGTQPVVALKDAAGNTTTADNSSVVTMTVSAGASVVGTATATAAAGVATFLNVGISGTTGTPYTLTFASGALTSATQSITPTSGAAAKLVLTTPAAGAASGAAFTTQPVVTVQDNASNTVTSDNTTVVTMTVSSGGTVVGTATATASSGVATFSTVGISGLVGSYNLTFGSGALTSATQSGLALAHGAATQLAVTTAAGGAPAGAAFTTQPVVTVRDGAGNTVTNDGSSVVTMTVSAGATVFGTATATASAGVATFAGAGITGTAGTAYTLTFASGSLTNATQSITSSVGPAHHLSVTTAAAGSASGVAFTTQPAIAVQDAGNNLVTTSAATVTMTVSAGASVVGTATATAAGGVATFSNVGISGTTGTQYTLTYGSGSLTSATQFITPTFGAPAQLALTTPAAGAASGAAFSTQPVVTVRDAVGNTVANDNSTVVTMSVSVGGTVVGTGTATASSGVATFSTVGISGLVGSYNLTFSSGVLTSATQSGLALAHGAAAQLALTTPASGAPAGAAFTIEPAVTVRDGAGNPVTNDNSTVVTMTVGAGATTFGTATATASSGVAQFTTAGIVGTAGVSYTLTYASGSLTSTSQSILAAIGPVTHLVVATPATGAASGIAFTGQPVIHSLDAGNNLVTTDGSTVVTMTVSGGIGSPAVVGTASATAASGVATFANVGLSGLIATYTLTYGSPSLVSATQTIALTAGVGKQWTFTQQPSGAASSLLITSQPILQLRDSAGNPVSQAGVALTASLGGGGTLTGTPAGLTDVNGVVTYTDLVITGIVGPRTLSFTSSLPTVTSASFTLTPGPATQLVLTTAAAGAASGAAFTTVPVVAVQDAQGNTETADGSTLVTMAVSAGASVTGTATVTVAGGVATFIGTGLTGTIGSYNLTFTSAPVRTPATQNGLVLALGAATHLALTTPAAGAENGAAFATPPVVQVQDAGNNLETADGTTQVTMTVSAGATIVGTATATASGGVATFSTVGITGTPGTAYTLTFSSGALTASTQQITAALGLATHLTLTTSAAGAASGAAFTTQPVVEVRDAGNFLETGDNATVVTMTVSGSATTVPVTATATAVGGVATFSGVGISGVVGPYTLTFASGSLTSATQPITLTPGAPTHFTFTTQPGGAASGVVFTTQPVLQLRDAQGNAVALAGVGVTASIATGGPALSGTTSITTTVAGVAAFTNLMITGTIGDRTLNFASTFPTVTSNTVTVTPGPAAKLVLTQPAGGAASGSAFTTQPIVELRDAQDNVETGDNGSQVAITIGGGPGTPSMAGGSTVTVSAGVATFVTAAALGQAGGSYTLTYTSGAFTTAQFITVTTGVGTQLQFVLQPSASAQNDVVFPVQPSLQLRDSYGNLVSQSGVIVTAALQSGAPALGGTLTAITDGLGVATFTDLKITGLIGNRTLHFTSNIPGAVTLVSSTVTVTPGAATKLSLTTAAAGAASGAPFTTQPVVTVQDVSGNTVTGNGSTVLMTIDGGASTVPGSATATATAGVAQFSNVGVSGTAIGGYTLTYSDGPLTPVTQPIAITPGAAAQLIPHTLAAGAVNGLPFGVQPVVYVEDAQGNLRTNDNGTQVTLTSDALQTTGTTLVTASGGVVSFGNVGINGSTVGSYTLTFSSGGLPDLHQAGVTPALGPANHLAVATPAALPHNGQAFGTQPAIVVLDAGNNVETGDGSTVVTMSVSAGASTVGTVTATASSGFATFLDVGITGTVGQSYTLTYSSGPLTLTQQSITAQLGPATHLVLATPAAGAASGAPFTAQPVVYVEDAGNNIVTTDGSTIVTMTVDGAATTVPATATATASGGVASFSGVGISGPVGPYTLTYSSSPVLTAPTQSIGLAAGVATQFSITTQPGGAASGSLLSPQPVLQLLDGAGNVVTQAGVDVTVSVASGSGTLSSGTLTVHTDATGKAIYTDLVITGADTYTLLFTASLLANPTKTSDPFVVTP